MGGIEPKKRTIELTIMRGTYIFTTAKFRLMIIIDKKKKRKKRENNNKHFNTLFDQAIS